MTISERSAKILEAVQTFFDHVDARSVTEPDGAVVTEGGSRNDGDVRLLSKRSSEILGSQSKLTDIHQHIKRPCGLTAVTFGSWKRDRTYNCDAYRIPRAYRRAAVDHPLGQRARHIVKGGRVGGVWL